MDEKLKKWRRNFLDRYQIAGLYYVSFCENLNGILGNGILPKREVQKRGLAYRSFAIESVQQRRASKDINITGGAKRNIHDLVPLYITPRTATLYKVRELQNEMFMAVIGVSMLYDAVDGLDVQFAFTDGNAASVGTRFYCDLRDLDKLPWDVIKAHYWGDYDDGTRKRCSEFLIWPRVPVERIEFIVVKSSEMKQKLSRLIRDKNITIEVKLDNKGEYFFI